MDGNGNSADGRKIPYISYNVGTEPDWQISPIPPSFGNKEIDL